MRRQETIETLTKLMELAKDKEILDFDHLRLGQLLLNACPETILYYSEAPELLKRVENYLKK